jgi:hypothetical protein
VSQSDQSLPTVRKLVRDNIGDKQVGGGGKITEKGGSGNAMGIIGLQANIERKKYGH